MLFWCRGCILLIGLRIKLSFRNAYCQFDPCPQVLPLVPPGRKSGEDGSPYSGQVMLYVN